MKIILFKDFSLLQNNKDAYDNSVSVDFFTFILSKPKLEYVTGKHTKEKCMSQLQSVLNFDKWFEEDNEVETGSEDSTDSENENIVDCNKKIEMTSSIRMRNVNEANTSVQLEIELCTRQKDCVFFQLWRVFKDKIKLQLQLKVSGIPSCILLAETNKIDKRHYTCQYFPKVGGHGATFCFQNVPEQIKTKWETNKKFAANLTLSIHFEKEAMETLLFAKESNIPSLNAYRKMFYQDVGKDAVLITDGGEEIECHSCVLAARSHIFEKVFKDEMNKILPTKIKISGYKPVELKAFLEYIYKWEVKQAIFDLHLAIQLLKLGNFYQIHDLLGSMREIFMFSTYTEIGIELAVELLIFTKDASNFINTDGYGIASGTTQTPQSKRKEVNAIWNDLTLKAVLVLKWYTTEEPSELMSSERYKRLFEETPQIAMELDAKFLQFVSTDAIQKKAGNGTLVKELLD